AGARPANGGERFQVLQLHRCGRLRELSMELGGPEIDDTEGERGGRLPGRVERGQRRLQRAGGVPVVTLLVELRRARDGVVRRPRRRRPEHREGHQQRGTPAGHHQSFSFATKIWSHWSTSARNAITPSTEQVTSWFIFVSVLTRRLVPRTRSTRYRGLYSDRSSLT